jgi:tripartite-type tricarboxylate transporter receptor subunit TctC
MDKVDEGMTLLTAIASVLLARCRQALIIAILSVAGGHALAVEPVAQFYAGKTVTIIVTTASGSAYDYGARVFARHFGRHIPGNPAVLVENKPGGGGRIGTAYVYSVAQPDGTAVGAVQSFIATDPLFTPNVLGLFDPRRFNWLGSIDSTTSVAVAWHSAPIKTYADLFDKQLIVGGVGTGTPMVTMPYLFKRLLGMKLKVVPGYQSGGDVNLAMERGEIQGRMDYSWHNLTAEHPDWLAEKKLNLLFQIGLRKREEIEQVPLVLDMTNDQEKRKILETIFFSYEFGRAFMMAPGVPVERVQALRIAFMDTMKDPEFLQDAKTSNLEVSPVPAKRLQDLVEEAYKQPANLITRAIELQKPD